MDYVWAASEGLVAWGPNGSRIPMNVGDLWFADDPFVLARPEMFSATPQSVRSTTGREAPGATPVASSATEPEPRVRGRARG